MMLLGRSALAPGYRWLLSLKIGRTVYRIADSAVSVESAEFGPLQYLSGLVSVDVSIELATEPGAAEEMSIPIQLRFPGDLAALWFAGVPIHLATAELAILPSGGSWETRTVVMDGLLDLEELALPGQTVRAQLSPELSEDDLGTILDPERRVGPKTQPLALSPLQTITSCYGRWYPMPFGRPGLGAPGSPAFQLRTSGARYEVMVAGGFVPSTTVDLIDGGNHTGSDTLAQLTDGLGQTYTSFTTNAGGPGDDPTDGGDKIFVAWPEAGAIPDPYDGTLWTKATSHLRWMAERSTIQYDLGSIISAADVLDRYRIDGFWDDQGKPSEFIEDELLPILPLSLAPGPGGHFFTLLRRPPIEHECIDHLTVGQDCWQVGRPKLVKPRSDLSSSVRVEYAYSPVSEGYGSSISLSAEEVLYSQTGSAARDTTTHRSGLFEANPSGGESKISSRFVWRDSTAGLIAADEVVRAAVPVAELTLRVRYDKARIQPGMGVLLTASDYSLSRMPCRVVAWTPTTTGLLLTLELMRLPFRD